MFIPVADVHGIIDPEILSKFYCLFDIYVIHVLSTNIDD